MPNSPQTLLGFDFGTKRIGVAVGQTLTGTANPLKTLKAENGEPNWSEIAEIVREWGANGCVVGVPYDMSEDTAWMTAAAQTFAAKLGKQTQLPIYLIDERLTTKSARQLLHENRSGQRKAYENVDDYCAALILEAYMRS